MHNAGSATEPLADAASPACVRRGRCRPWAGRRSLLVGNQHRRQCPPVLRGTGRGLLARDSRRRILVPPECGS